MNLRQLRYFVAVAETLNFTQAARRLCIAQPPLSRQIKELEVEIGAPLFTRDGHTMQLTAAGLALRDEAYDILQRCQEALSITRAIAQGATGHLVIGYMPVAFCYPNFTLALKRFHECYPGIRLTLQQMAPSRQREALAKRQIDFGLMHTATADASCNTLRVHDEPAEVALPKHHPLADADSITVADLAQEPWIMMARRWCPTFHDRCLHPWREHGMEPNIVQETESYAVSLSLVAMGMGITLGSASLRKHFTTPVASQNITGLSLRIGTDLVWKKDQESPAMQSFTSTLLQQF